MAAAANCASCPAQRASGPGSRIGSMTCARDHLVDPAYRPSTLTPGSESTVAGTGAIYGVRQRRAMMASAPPRGVRCTRTVIGLPPSPRSARDHSSASATPPRTFTSTGPARCLRSVVRMSSSLAGRAATMSHVRHHGDWRTAARSHAGASVHSPSPGCTSANPSVCAAAESSPLRSSEGSGSATIRLHAAAVGQFESPRPEAHAGGPANSSGANPWRSSTARAVWEARPHAGSETASAPVQSTACVSEPARESTTSSLPAGRASSGTSVPGPSLTIKPV